MGNFTFVSKVALLFFGMLIVLSWLFSTNPKKSPDEYCQQDPIQKLTYQQYMYCYNHYAKPL